MNAIHREHGFTLGQDEQSSAVYGMPRTCAEMGILDRVVPLSQIPHEIIHATHYRKTSAAKRMLQNRETFRATPHELSSRASERRMVSLCTP